MFHQFFPTQSDDSLFTNWALWSSRSSISSAFLDFQTLIQVINWFFWFSLIILPSFALFNLFYLLFSFNFKFVRAIIRVVVLTWVLPQIFVEAISLFLYFLQSISVDTELIHLNILISMSKYGLWILIILSWLFVVKSWPIQLHSSDSTILSESLRPYLSFRAIDAINVMI